MKFIRSLHHRKFREKERLFIAEGVKIVNELIRSDLEVRNLFATADWQGPPGIVVEQVREEELKQVSLLEAPNKVLAVANIPEPQRADSFPGTGPVFLLDGIQDPGNLGTILRTCEWFGFPYVICLPGTAEPFGPKVVQASMGSVFRVRCLHSGHDEAITMLRAKGYELLAAVPYGEPAGAIRFGKKTAVVLGNESAGISKYLLDAAERRIAIPHAGSSHAESLNVSAAASILCYLVHEGRISA